MLVIRRTPRAAMAAAHAAAAPAPPPPRPQETGRAALNLQPALDLGDTVYFLFRGRAYGVPPVPYRAGLRLQALWIEAGNLPATLDGASASRYGHLLATLPPLLWSLTRPVGFLRRALAACRLLRNPFVSATEGEIVAVAGFILGCRMRSSVTLPAPPLAMSRTS